MPQAIINIKQNTLHNSKTWQVGEEKTFAAAAIEVTFSKKSLGYYQITRSGNKPEANQIKERKVQAGGGTVFAYPENKFKHSGIMKRRRTNQNNLSYSLLLS